MGDKQVVVIGGSGFLGRYVVRELARAGWRIRVICRRPNAANYLKTAGDLGQVVLTYGDLARHPDRVTPYVFEADAVVNLTGILYEKGAQKFQALHALGARALANAARMARVKAMVHVSSLGINKSERTSHYAASKLAGEQVVKAAFAEATILRPSVMFGPGDGFLCRFGGMARFSPALPLIGGGHTRFQPVYVADVARAVRICLENSATHGKTFELGGPEVFTMKQVLELILQQTNRHCQLVNIPFALAGMMATFAELLPLPPLTPDQVRLLRYDNTVEGAAQTLVSLGITPTAMQLVAAEALAPYRKPGLVHA